MVSPPVNVSVIVSVVRDPSTLCRCSRRMKAPSSSDFSTVSTVRSLRPLSSARRRCETKVWPFSLA